jgi:hypothetical protein
MRQKPKIQKYLERSVKLQMTWSDGRVVSDRETLMYWLVPLGIPQIPHGLTRC